MATLLQVKKKLSPVLARQYLLEQYETRYGVFDHDASKDPLALVYFNESESAVIGSLLQRRMTQYREREVKDIFGLSWSEFLARPHFEVELMLDECDKVLNERSRADAIKLDRLEAEAGK